MATSPGLPRHGKPGSVVVVQAGFVLRHSHLAIFSMEKSGSEKIWREVSWEKVVLDMERKNLGGLTVLATTSVTWCAATVAESL